MASFISTFSLFVLVLINLCFTLPIQNEELTTSTTFLSFSNDLTTEKPLGLRMVSDNESTDIVPSPIKLTSDNPMDMEMSTSADDKVLFESASRSSRTFDESFNLETSTFVPTTEQPIHEKREQHDLFTSSFEPITEDFQLMTESSTSNLDDKTITESSPMKRNFHELSTATFELLIDNNTIETDHSDSTHDDHKKRQTDMELTTSFTPLLTSTLSTVTEELSVNEPLTFTTISTPGSTSTKLYTGLLTDETKVEPDQQQLKEKEDKESKADKQVEEEEEEKEKEQPTESPLKLTTKSPNVKMNIKDKVDHHEEKEKEEFDGEKQVPEEKEKQVPEEKEPEKFDGEKQAPEEGEKPTKVSREPTTRRDPTETDENIKDSKIPTALLDQDALKKISYVSNDFMILDENTDFAVTTPSTKPSKSTGKPIVKGAELNQDEKSSNTEEKKSGN